MPRWDAVNRLSSPSTDKHFDKYTDEFLSNRMCKIEITTDRSAMPPSDSAGVEEANACY